MSGLINANGAPCPHCADLGDHLKPPHDPRSMTQRYDEQVADTGLVWTPNDEADPIRETNRAVRVPGKILAYLRLFR